MQANRVRAVHVVFKEYNYSCFKDNKYNKNNIIGLMTNLGLNVCCYMAKDVQSTSILKILQILRLNNPVQMEFL